MDAVNAFVHAKFDELVYIRLPPGFGQTNKVAVRSDHTIMIVGDE